MEDFNLDFTNKGETTSLADFIEADEITVDSTPDTTATNPIDTAIPTTGLELDDLVDIPTEVDIDPVDVDPITPITEDVIDTTDTTDSTDSTDAASVDKKDAKGDDTPVDSTYSDLLSAMYDIDMVEIDGEEVPITEANLTKEDFIALSADLRKEREGKLVEGKVSVSELPEITQKLIDISKAGGDITSALQSYEQYQSPIDNLNLDSVEDQVKAVMILHTAQDKDEEESNILIEKYRETGVLKDKAEDATSMITNAFNRHLDKIKEDSKSAQEAYAENMKNYRGDLDEQLKEMGISNKNARTQLVDLATVKTKDTFALDEIYKDTKNNPKEAAELLLFLNNKEDYLKTKFSELERDIKLSYMKTARLVRASDKTSGKSINPDSIDNKAKKGDVDIDSLI